MNFEISLLQSILLATFGYLFVKSLVCMRKKRAPGPPFYPVIGQFYELFVRALPHVLKQTVPAYAMECRKKYGRIVQFGGQFASVVMIADADVAKMILTTPDIFHRGKKLQTGATDLLDYALSTLDTNHTWYRHRKTLQPSLGPWHLRQAEQLAEQKIDEAIIYWLKMDGKPIIMQNQISIVGMDIMGQLAFGHDFNAVANYYHGNELPSLEYLNRIFGGLGARIFIPKFMWRLFNLHSSNPYYVEANQYFWGMLRELVPRYKEEAQSGNIALSKTHWNVLQRMLACTGNDAFTDKEIVGEIIGYFIAGQDTTSNTFTWAMKLLSERPDIVARLREEIDPLVESKPQDWFNQLYKLKYLDNFIKEVQRLFPVIPAVTKKCNQNVTIQGYEFEKGTDFFIYLRGIHLDPEYWPEPEVFNPDRWNGKIYQNAYLPFSEGPTKCLGFKLAVMELKIFTAKVLYNCDFELVKDQDLRLLTSMTSHFVSGLEIKMRPRKF